MAQSKNTSSAKKTTNTKPAKKKPAIDIPPQENPPRPVRRELGSIVFLMLAVFTVISHFNTDGQFVRWFANGLKGFVGWGFWVCVPAFLLVSVILGFHRGRPVTLRMFCALLVPVLVSAIVSMVSYSVPEEQPLLQELTGRLFDEGLAMQSAGVFGGLLAIGLERAFGIYGAMPVVVAALIFCVVKSVNGSFKSIFSKTQKRVTVKYDPTMYQRQGSRDEEAMEPVDVKRDSAAMRTKNAGKKSKIEMIDRNACRADIPLFDSDDEDDVSRLRTGGRKQGAVRENDRLPERDNAPAKSKKTPVPVTRIKREPEGIDAVPTEAEKAGVDVAGLRSTVEELMKPVPVTAEINDPPKKKAKRTGGEAKQKQSESRIILTENGGEYRYPPFDLLRSGSVTALDAREEIAANKQRLEAAMDSFGIHAQIIDIIRGPTVTRYDIELPQGIKLSKVTNLAGDLALSLGVINVRIAPIPDKISTVGIEVPNRIVSTVYLRDIIDSENFTKAKSKLSFAIGKNISGECVVGNISKLPHMLIAGTTGSGKSVCMNSLILSLLYKATPDEVKLIMIDPKMVELGVYNGIPHLYVPVVTDPKKAAGALQWSVVEMLKRYRLFSEIGVRDLDSYNKHCEANGEAAMPRVVIVIDELADLMLVASKDVEESICRVAQMGRAAGMHLVIATQRPSADVITGLMKANIPSRIAFAVSSALESRIILDQAGAEKLVGMGDMLYSPVGIGKPVRIQGAYVSDEERESVIQFIKESSSCCTSNSEIEQFMNKAAEEKGGVSKGGRDRDSAGADEGDGFLEGYDEMLPQAVECVIETKSCSVSMLQRRVKLGYSRAARIVDQMEELGIVGPYEGAKPRSVLVDREGWLRLQKAHGLISDDDMALASRLSDESED